MYQMKQTAIALAAFAFLTQGRVASALPFVDGSAGAAAASGGINLDRMAFRGIPADGDQNTIYLPWHRLVMVKKDGIPQFSFAYSRKGALMTTTLKASAGTPEEIETVVAPYRQAMVNDGIPESAIKVGGLPVRKGTYTSTLSMKNVGDFVIATTEVQNAIPTNEIAMSMLMGRSAADLVAMSLKGEATTLGFNYTYDFAARTMPYRAEITVDWSSTFKYLRTQYGFANAAGSFQMDKISRKLVEDKLIDINVVEGDKGEVWDQVISDVVKIVIARCFKANHPAPQDQKMQLPKPQPGLVENVVLGMMPGIPTQGWNTGVSAAYSLSEMKSEEQVTETIRIKSQPLRVLTAAAGVQLGNVCNQFPDSVRYQGEFDATTNTYAVKSGCPDNIYGDTPAFADQAKPGGGDNGFAIGQPGGKPPVSGPPSKLDQAEADFLQSGSSAVPLM